VFAQRLVQQQHPAARLLHCTACTDCSNKLQNIIALHSSLPTYLWQKMTLVRCCLLCCAEHDESPTRQLLAIDASRPFSAVDTATLPTKPSAPKFYTPKRLLLAAAASRPFSAVNTATLPTKPAAPKFKTPKRALLSTDAARAWASVATAAVPIKPSTPKFNIPKRLLLAAMRLVPGLPWRLQPLQSSLQHQSSTLKSALLSGGAFPNPRLLASR
jgi:hypothetical protein